MKTTIITTFFLFFTLMASAQNYDKTSEHILDSIDLALSQSERFQGYYVMVFGGSGAPVLAINIDNIVIPQDYAPFMKGDFRLYKNKLIFSEELNGFILDGYTEGIYDVDGKLYLTSEDKKALSSIDWRDIESFTFIPKRKAKQIYGKIGRKGAVLIKTKIDNNINIGSSLVE